MALHNEFHPGENGWDTPEGLATMVVAAYNATVHESMDFSPNFLTYGRELAAPVDVALGNPPGEQMSLKDYADHLVTMLRDAHNDAREHLAEQPKELSAIMTSSPIRSHLNWGA